MNKNKKGFTLIEMLIVIAVIGILASIVLIGLGPVQRKGRDARRISDVRGVQTALELYFSKCGYYPGPAAAPNCSGFSAITGTDAAKWTALSGAILGSGLGVNQALPNDPIAGRSYLYGSDGVTYVVGAVLEDTGNSALNGDVDTMIHNVDCGTAATDSTYCVRL